MFIQRLKIKDITEFVSGLDFDSISVNLCNYTKEPYLRIFFDYKSTNIYAKLYDFKAIGVSRNWQKFLYSRFGEEYKKEYEKYLDNLKSVRLEKLTS